jgi:hypothetical protein
LHQASAPVRGILGIFLAAHGRAGAARGQSVSTYTQSRLKRAPVFFAFVINPPLTILEQAHTV